MTVVLARFAVKHAASQVSTHPVLSTKDYYDRNFLSAIFWIVRNGTKQYTLSIQRSHGATNVLHFNLYSSKEYLSKNWTMCLQ